MELKSIILQEFVYERRMQNPFIAMAQMLSSNGVEQDQLAASAKENPTSLFRVFPIPTKEVINVELSSELVGEFQLFNSSGQVIQEGAVTKSFELYIPITGEYFIRILGDQSVYHERITVVK